MIQSLKSEKGTVLIIVMVFAVILTASSVTLLDYSIMNNHAARSNLDRMRAIHAAESGINCSHHDIIYSGGNGILANQTSGDDMWFSAKVQEDALTGRYTISSRGVYGKQTRHVQTTIYQSDKHPTFNSAIYQGNESISQATRLARINDDGEDLCQLTFGGDDAVCTNTLAGGLANNPEYDKLTATDFGAPGGGNTHYNSISEPKDIGSNIDSNISIADYIPQHREYNGNHYITWFYKRSSTQYQYRIEAKLENGRYVPDKDATLYYNTNRNSHDNWGSASWSVPGGSSASDPDQWSTGAETQRGLPDFIERDGKLHIYWNETKNDNRTVYVPDDNAFYEATSGENRNSYGSGVDGATEFPVPQYQEINNNHYITWNYKGYVYRAPLDDANGALADGEPVQYLKTNGSWGNSSCGNVDLAAGDDGQWGKGGGAKKGLPVFVKMQGGEAVHTTMQEAEYIFWNKEDNKNRVVYDVNANNGEGDWYRAQTDNNFMGYTFTEDTADYVEGDIYNRGPIYVGGGADIDGDVETGSDPNDPPSASYPYTIEIENQGGQNQGEISGEILEDSGNNITPPVIAEMTYEDKAVGSERYVPVNGTYEENNNQLYVNVAQDFADPNKINPNSTLSNPESGMKSSGIVGGAADTPIRIFTQDMYRTMSRYGVLDFVKEKQINGTYRDVIVDSNGNYRKVSLSNGSYVDDPNGEYLHDGHPAFANEFTSHTGVDPTTWRNRQFFISDLQNTWGSGGSNKKETVVIDPKFNQKVYYIEGNLWVESSGNGPTFKIQKNCDEDVRVTFVVKGNIYICDANDANIPRDGDGSVINENIGDGIAMIAIGGKKSGQSDPEVREESYLDYNHNHQHDPGEPIIHDDPVGSPGHGVYNGRREGSGNIFFGDPSAGHICWMGSSRDTVNAFLFAENDILDHALDTQGVHEFQVVGIYSAGNRVDINREMNGVHGRMEVRYDPRILLDGFLPGIPKLNTEEGGVWYLYGAQIISEQEFESIPCS